MPNTILPMPRHSKSEMYDPLPQVKSKRGIFYLHNGRLSSHIQVLEGNWIAVPCSGFLGRSLTGAF
jgi:hypothetical protein